MKLAISNSGPLIHLARLNRLDLLFNLFDKILIPEEVFIETVKLGLENNFIDAKRIKKEIKNKQIEVKKENPESYPESPNLHLGELAAIALALKFKEEIILLDDEEVRVFARFHDLKVKGTIGIIIENVKFGHISKEKGKKIVRSLNQIMYLSGDVFNLAMEKIESFKTK